MMEQIKQADKNEEVLKIYDDNNKWTGEYLARGLVHPKKKFHREVALWVIDIENNSILLQKRTPDKMFGANKLGVCAGHIAGNETIKEALYKEAKEELGIDLEQYRVHKLISFKKQEKNNNCFIYHFYTLSYVPLKEIDIQEEELSRVLYMDYDFVKKCIINKDERFMIPYDENHKKLFQKLDNIIKREKKKYAK